MKPCQICQQPKTYHTWYYVHGDDGHEFQMDNLAYLELKVKKKEREEKHCRLNFCQICKLIKKSPFGICKECSEVLIKEKQFNGSLV